MEKKLNFEKKILFNHLRSFQNQKNSFDHIFIRISVKKEKTNIFLFIFTIIELSKSLKKEHNVLMKFRLKKENPYIFVCCDLKGYPKKKKKKLFIKDLEEIL